MMTNDPFSFEHPLEWLLAGTPDMVKSLIVRVAGELEVEGSSFAAAAVEIGRGLPAIVIGVISESESGTIGIIQVEGLPGERTRLRVPAERGAKIRDSHYVPTPWHDVGPTANWRKDPRGEFFSAFLGVLLLELRNSGFLSTSSRFESHSVVETARRELDAAEDAASLAAIGNICRSAMVALADELYADHMLRTGQTAPKRDDATGRLKVVLSHYFAGRSERYRRGLSKSIEASWDVSAALVHRKRATREEGETCFALLKGLFEAFSFIAPQPGTVTGAEEPK